MLGLRFIAHAALIAIALDTAVPALAQQGTNERIDAAEKKLDADIKACRPINPAEYKELVDETNRNVKAAKAAARAGAPVDVSRLNADLEKASALYRRASDAAAAAKPCPPPQQQPQPPNQAPAPPPARPVLPGQAQKIIKDPFQQLEDDAEDALDDLDDAMDDCDEDAVKALIPKLQDLSRQAHAAANAARAAGQFSKVDPKEAEAMAKDLEEAIADAQKFKCPIKPKLLPKGLHMPRSMFDQRILYIHNEERTAVHVPDLNWNYKLEWDAFAYASHLADTRQLLHAPREGRGIERENLLQTLPGWSPDRMMQSWTVEKRDFRPGYFPNVAIDGNWLDVAHYTQMIWPTTTDLGCGYAMGGGFGWLVCRYSPGGNKDGQPVGNAEAAAAAFRTVGETNVVPAFPPNQVGEKTPAKDEADKPAPGASSFKYGSVTVTAKATTFAGDNKVKVKGKSDVILNNKDVVPPKVADSVAKASPSPEAAAAFKNGSATVSGAAVTLGGKTTVRTTVGAVTPDAVKTAEKTPAATASGNSPTVKAPAGEPSLHEKIKKANDDLGVRIMKYEPIDVSIYTRLAEEAHRQWDETEKQVKKAAKAGAAIDPEKARDVEDLHKAIDLAEKAKEAAKVLENAQHK